nr:MAG TPA: hypothetical protein [Ackermannviridae sp.]
MEDYKLRMINEYKNLKEKYNELHKMLVKYDTGKLDFTPTCRIDLLRKQASFMRQYLYILEVRAVIEDVDLNTEDRDDKEESEDGNNFLQSVEKPKSSGRLPDAEEARKGL